MGPLPDLCSLNSSGACLGAPSPQRVLRGRFIHVSHNIVAPSAMQSSKHRITIITTTAASIRVGDISEYEAPHAFS